MFWDKGSNILEESNKSLRCLTALGTFGEDRNSDTLVLLGSTPSLVSVMPKRLFLSMQITFARCQIGLRT